MITQKNAEKIIHGVFTEVWQDRDIEAVPKYYHPDFLGLLNDEEEFNYSDVLKRVEYGRLHYDKPDIYYEDIFVALENRIIFRISMEAIEKSSKKLEKFHFIVIVEIKDNKMFRQWAACNRSYRYKAWE